MSKRKINRSPVLLLTILFFVPLLSYAQDIPCRDWYYVSDRNGNKIKDKCKEAWQENDIGQKSGKYVYYKDNGAAQEVAYYKNDVLHGRYVYFSKWDQTIYDSGRYINGKRNGRWLLSPYTVTFSNDKIVGGTTYSNKYGQIFEGRFEKSGYYSGLIAYSRSEDWKNKFYDIAFDRDICGNGECLRISNQSSQLIDFWLDEAKFYSENNKLDFTKITVILTLKDGEISPIPPISIRIGNATFASSLLKEKNDATRKELETIRNTNSIAAVDISKFPAPPSIKCKAKSYDIEDNSALDSLKKYLQKVNTAGIKNLLLIGHADAYKDLGVYSFNSESRDPVHLKDGRQTQESEQDLATIRFYLSVGRLKTVYNAIADLEAIKKLILERKFLMLAAGTSFGEELKNSNPDIVQIVVITEDSREINSEPLLLSLSDNPYDNKVTLDGNFFKRVNKYSNDISYLIGGKSFFIYNYLGKDTFGKKIPPYHLFQTNFNAYRDCNYWREDTWDK